MSQGIRDRVTAIAAEQAVLDVEQITLRFTLAELGMDSLGLVESLLAIEEAFDISIPFNANEPGWSDVDLSSMASITAPVEKLVAERA